MSSTAGRVAQEVLRTHYRLLDFNLKKQHSPKTQILNVHSVPFPFVCLMGASGAHVKGRLNVRPPAAVTTGGPEKGHPKGPNK